ncbi:MAG: tetratricopeptide repeat protein [Prevotella sp.]|jgi:predicted RNase H-like HicB family nuclease|nr:tetratricopeptide repeat protein [Prevotella sp.]
MLAALIGLFAESVVTEAGSITAQTVFKKLKGEINKTDAEKIGQAYLDASTKFSELDKDQLDAALKNELSLIGDDSYYHQLIYSFSLVDGKELSDYHKCNCKLFLSELFKDENLRWWVINTKLDDIHREVIGIRDNIKHLPEDISKIVRPIIINNQGYHTLLKDIQNLQKFIEIAPTPEMRSDLIDQLNAKLQELQDMERAVYEVYDTINKIPINSKRLRKAKEYFENGNFREADAILKTEEIQGEVDQLKAKKEKAAAEMQSADRELEDRANEFLMKAQVQLTYYDKPDRFESAKEYYEKALDAFRLPEALFNYAKFLHEHNQYKEAEPIYIEVLYILKKLTKKNPKIYEPNLAGTLNNLGILYKVNNDLIKAERNYQEALVIKRNLAKENPKVYQRDVAMALNNLANLHSDTNNLEEAEREYQEALGLYRKLAEENPRLYSSDIAMILNNLGVLHMKANGLEEAEKNFCEALAIRRKLAEENSKVYILFVAETLNNLATLHSDTNNLEEAEQEFKEALAIRRTLAKENPRAYDPYLAMILMNLGIFYYKKGDKEQLIRYAKEAYKILLPIYKQIPVYGKYMEATIWLLEENGIDPDSLGEVVE